MRVLLPSHPANEWDKLRSSRRYTVYLRLISGNTLPPIEDSGNANPDCTFRYDSTLGGTGGGYIFNLNTKGLGPGQYILSFYVGGDRSFFFTVKFEVK